MPDILAIAEASMRNSMQQLDAISRNVANINTQGYKREIYLNRGFQDHMNSAAAPSVAGANFIDTGAGGTGAMAHRGLAEAAEPQSIAPSIDVDPTLDPGNTHRLEAHDFSPGSLKRTGSPLHMAIEGKGYFQLQTPQGIVLTRDGQFAIDARGQLTAADGAPVLMRGSLALDSAALDRADFTVLADGTLDAGEQQAQFDLVDAPVEALRMIGPGRYSANTTTALLPGSYQLRQGYIENSNVDSLTEMTGMMSTVRHIEASQQLMRAYDEIIDNAISTLGQF